MKFSLSTVLTLLGIFLAQSVSADELKWGTCDMSFKVNIRSTLIWQSGEGKGMLRCADHQGRETIRPVQIAIKGWGFGIGIFKYEGVAGGIGAVNPEQLAGTYYVADANLALGIGLGLSLDFYNQDNGLSFGGKVKAGTGIGVALNGSTWTVSLVD